MAYHGNDYAGIGAYISGFLSEIEMFYWQR